MGNRPWNRVRVALVGVLALLTVGLVGPNVAAQFGRPPGMPAQPQAPPGMPGGGGGGFPQPQFPQPNFPKMPRMPEPPQPQPVVPNFPQPVFPDVPKMPDIPRGPLIERIWTCSGCGKEIGRGNFPPATCPHCNARITNGMGGGDKPPQDNGGGMLAPKPVEPRGFGGDFNLPAPGQPPVGEFREPNLDAGWKSDFQKDAEEEQKRAKEEAKAQASAKATLWTVVGVVAGLSVLLIIGLVLLAILSQSGRKKAKRRRPKRKVSRYDDEDDDDDYIPRSKRSRRHD